MVSVVKKRLSMVETAGEGKDKIGEEKRKDGHCREGTGEETLKFRLQCVAKIEDAVLSYPNCKSRCYYCA